MVVDFRAINQNTYRVGIPFNSATDIWRQIPDEAAAFLSLDLVSSFFQLCVDKRDQHYLTFIVPDGKFYMKRAAIGEKNSGDTLNVHTRCLLVGLSLIHI